MPTARKSTARKRAAKKTDDATLEDVNFYNQHERASGRQPGIYLDAVEREAAEVIRAKKEDREPDLDNPPATAGTPLVLAGQLATDPNNGMTYPTDDSVAAEPFVTLSVSRGALGKSEDEDTEPDNEDTES